MNERCFACGRKLGKKPHIVDTLEDQFPPVGSECFKLIEKAGTKGYQPSTGGPRLYLLTEERKRYANERFGLKY